MRRTAVVLVCLAAASPAAAVDYLREVKPILRQHCFRCHGALAQKARLRLDTRAAMLAGGRHGPAIVPGQPGKSPLLERIAADEGERMPPDGAGLSAVQIAILKRWVAEGAAAPAGEKPEEDPRQHWAFRPLHRPAVPAVRNVAWVRNPIDAFIAAEHERRGLAPATEAPREVLLRRLALDLTGLPPTPEEVDRFLHDSTPSAHERQVERLLASPAHGERWARHWMDVWRYSDWYGRRAVPDVWNSAPQVWRWRDWIVASLNRDRGYDYLVQMMLAADEIAPGDDEAAVATGYLVRNWYALNPNQWMRDNVEHTGKAFLALTFNCCHCHDHKYDPISQEEYFRFRAFFEPLGLRQDRVRGEPEPGPFQKYSLYSLRKVVNLGRVSAFDEQPGAKTWLYQLGDERERIKGRPPATPAAPAFLGGDRLQIEPVRLPLEVVQPALRDWQRADDLARHEQAVRTAEAGLARPAPGQAAVARAQLASARAALASYRARLAADDARRHGKPDPALDRAASKAERQAALAAAEEAVARAETLPPARKNTALVRARARVAAASKALAGDSTRYTPVGTVYPATSTGRRKALALWMTARDNPLTARVAVNHVWNWHFGRPLVETVADFGRNGHRPSHPELLDWLACELRDSGWSLKHLHRLILTSSTYRMHSAMGTSTSSHAADPDNRWLWRFPKRRVEAEVVRDSLLFVAGELDLRPGGPPVENRLEPTFRRRSLYFSVYPEDGGTARFLELFDAPDPCDCYRRARSVVPQQALALTNSALIHDLSARLAQRLGAGSDGEVVERAFLRVLSRRPTGRERSLCTAFLARHSGPAKGRAVEGLVRALFNHEEFLSLR